LLDQWVFLCGACCGGVERQHVFLGEGARTWRIMMMMLTASAAGHDTQHGAARKQAKARLAEKGRSEVDHRCCPMRVFVSFCACRGRVET